MKVGVHGSYFGYNFGDTLVFQLFVDWVRACGDHEVVLPLANEKNRRLIGADRRGLPAAFGAERVIFCGGGYFSESPSNPRWWSRRVFARHLWLGRLLKARRTPLAIMGVGVGPISDKRVQRSVVELFDYAEVTIVRDAESASCLRDWGLKRDVVVGSDAVLAADLRAMFAVGEAAPHSRKRLVIHGSGSTLTAGELNAIRAACTWAVDKGVNVVLVTDGVPRREAVQWPSAIAQEFPSLNAEIELYDGRPQSLARLLGQADGILTTKLHVGLVGTMLGIPVIAAPLHSKTIRFYRQIGHADRVVNMSEDGASDRLQALLARWYGGELSAPAVSSLPHFDYRAAVARFLG